MKKILLTVWLWLALQGIALATEDYHTNKSGSDANSCATAQSSTPSSAKLTINAGMSCLSAADGDTLTIGAGTYAEGLNAGVGTNFVSGTSYTNAATIRAETGATVIIRPGTTAYGPLYLSGRSYMKWEGLIFDGSATGNYTKGLTTFGGDRLRFTNCTFRNNSASGIQINGSFHEFINVVSHNNGTDFHDHGVYVDTASDTLIDGSTFHTNKGYGVHIFHSSSSTSTNRNVLRNSTIYNNGLDTANPSCGVILSSGTGNQAYNNFIYEHSTAQSFNCGILVGVVGSPSINAEVYNNTIVNNGNGTGHQINIQSNASGTIVRNNIAIEPAAGDGTTISNGGTGSTLSHNSETDSTTGYFVNVATDDYHLVGASSPAFGTGTPLTLFSTDFDGEERPQGSSWDRGADEFTSPPEGITVLTPNGGESVEVGAMLSITWSSVGIGGSTSQTFNTTGSWVSPITGNVQVDVWGGGGGGGGNTTSADGGGGGGGGAFSRENSLAVTATTSYTVTVGPGGAGGVGDTCGATGGDSWFSSAGTVFADDGNGGCNPIAGAAGVAGIGGEVSQGIGDVVFAGGNGANGNDNNAGTGGGGGGSAGQASSGGNASGQSAGSAGAGTPAGAPGGSGGNNDPSPGSTPGAGGGGAGDPGTGSAGAPGRVIVSWTTAATVNIELSRNNGSSWETLAAATPNDGAHDWTAAGATTVQGLIKITSTGAGAETDTSNAAFTIAGSVTGTITPTSLNGQRFKKGMSVPLAWTSADVSGNVRIDVSRDNGTTWDTIVASTPFNSSAQSWVAATPTSSNCKFRVVSLNNPAVLGTMSGTFRIGGSLTLFGR